MVRSQLLIILLVILYRINYAQENNFSHYYLVADMLNPAFTGDAYYISSQVITRVMQPIPGDNILSTKLSYNHKLINHRSGIGGFIYSQSGELRHLKIQTNYSYTFRAKRQLWIKGGLGIALNQRKANTHDFRYPDQYGIFGYTGTPTAEPDLSEKSNFASLSAGGVVYNHFGWFSVSTDYLNRPKEQFAGSKTIFPIRLTIMGGYLIPFNRNKSSKRRFSKSGGLKPYSSIGPQIGYIRQGYYSDISLGAALHTEAIYGSMHYRIHHTDKLNYPDNAFKSLSIVLGHRREEFSISYAYDHSLNNQGVNRRGSHEISLFLFFSKSKEDYKRNRLVPLPHQLIY